ncbi:hypothetical protein ACFO5Z_04780 [Salipiger abyssi]
MKLCVIGDSHVAMLMAALRDAGPGAPEVIWFAKPGLAEGEAALEGSRLCARDPDLVTRLESLGTPPEVDLDGVDAVVFVGGTVSAFGAVRLLQGHRVSGWPSARALIAAADTPSAAPLKQPLISERAYLAALEGVIRESVTHRLVTGLREASAVPVCVVPQPLPSEAILETEKKYPVFKRVARHGDGPAVAASLIAAHERAFAGLSGVTVFRQPEESIAQGFLTARAYTRDAVRLTAGAMPRDDVLHAGPALGALYLARIRAAVETLEI